MSDERNIRDFLEMAWQKARIIEGFDPDLFRQDACGAWIRKDLYGDIENMFGWGVDYIYPKSLGGTLIPENIRALNYHNIISKGNDYPSYKAVFTSEGTKNNMTELYLTVNDIIRKQLKKIYPDA